MKKHLLHIRRSLMLLTVCGLFLCTSCFSSNSILFDDQVLTGQLDNGLTYYLRQNKKPSERLEMRLVVKAGSVLEDDDQQGLAHFLEHMAFNGTENFDKNTLVDFLESIGMSFGPDLNAYTGFDQTVYQLTVPTKDPQTVDTGFQILRDWAFGLRNADDEINRERGVIIEEWRLGRGARQRIRDKQFPALFQGSRYADRLPIGKKELLDTFSFDRLRDFYKQWYKPEMMAVVVVGSLDPPEMLRQIHDHFDDIPSSASPQQLPDYPVPAHTNVIVSIAADPEATGSDVNLYYLLPPAPLKTEADYRNGIADALICHMLRQRLDERRQKADPPFLFAGAYKGPFIRTADLFYMGAQVKDGGFDAGLEAIMTEAVRVAQHGFTPTELERTKTEMLSQAEKRVKELDTTESSDFVRKYVDSHVYENVCPGAEAELHLHQELLPQIGLEELNARVKEWMTTGSCVILISGPEKPGITMPAEAEVLALYDRVIAVAPPPYVDDAVSAPLLPRQPVPGDIVKREEIQGLDLTVWTLSNGARVLVKPTTFTKDEIVFRACHPGGLSLATDECFIPAASANEGLGECGLGEFSKTQLAKKLAGKIASVDTSIEELRERLFGSCRTEDLETLMQLVYLKYTAPRADPAAFEAYCERTRTELKNRVLRPEVVFADEIETVMSMGHPRRLPWPPETVDRFDLDQSLDFYRSRFGNAKDATFLFVGDFDPQSLEKLVCNYLAALPSTGETETWTDHNIRRPEGAVEKTMMCGLAPKGRVRIIYSGPFVWSFQNRHFMRAMLTLLDIRLRDKIREELGGTYGVSVYSDQEHYPREEYAINISFGCSPDQVDALTAAVEQEIDRLKNEPISDMDLVKVKELLAEERRVGLERNGFWMYLLDFYAWHQEDPRIMLEFQSYVDGLTKEAIRTAAQTYFGTPNIATFILLPENSSVGVAGKEGSQ